MPLQYQTLPSHSLQRNPACSFAQTRRCPTMSATMCCTWRTQQVRHAAATLLQAGWVLAVQCQAVLRGMVCRVAER